jgi:hypothetical protein
MLIRKLIITAQLPVLSKASGQDFEHGNAQEQLEEQKEQAVEQT